MSNADARITSALPGQTIDASLPWKWVDELQRYTMPNCVFCRMCYDSTPCDAFLQAFQENTPRVVSSTMLSDGKRKIIAHVGALNDEYSIGRSDNELLAELGLQRASMGGWIERLLAEARDGLEGLLAERTRIAPSVVQAAGSAFVNGVKAGIHGEFAQQEAFKFHDRVRGGQARDAQDLADLVRQIRNKWMIADGALSAERIKDRFAALAKLAHPDSGGSDSAMRQLLQERQALIDSIRE
jgi:hypothetical protein